MLSARENFLELLNGGKPERFVNQYEPFAFLTMDPLRQMDKRIPGQDTKDSWGVTCRWKAGEHAGMPYITDDNKVCPDITRWRETVKAPVVELPAESWREVRDMAAQVDRKEQFIATNVSPGLIERLHFLMGFEDTLMNFLLEPEAVHELLDYILAWRMRYIREMIDNLGPEAILFHDDWGAKDRLFMSADIWREFFKPRYAQLYAYVRGRGVLVLHHADSYLTPITGDMAEIGIQVWQGVLPSNDITGIQKNLGGKMLLMGGLDAGLIDRVDWKEDVVRGEVRRACSEYAPAGGYIPCITYGGAESIYPGVYETISDEIRLQSRLYF
jgi:hypothetical protein